MAISKDEIDKYIFDPENPKQCKSYDALLNIAGKEVNTFISPDFLQYFMIFNDRNITKKFDKEIWDKEGYSKKNPLEKIKIFKKLYGSAYFDDFLNEQNLDKYLKKLNQKSKIFISLIPLYQFYGSTKLSKSLGNMLDLYKKEELNINENIIDKGLDEYEEQKNLILFFNNILELLNIKTKRPVIVVTLKKNINAFLKKQDVRAKIIPIFLKKIEDVDILLNVLEEDLKKENPKKLLKENIEFLNNVNIKNFFSINQIRLTNLKDKKEIYIVGENGDGKTLLLQAIAVGLKGTVEDGLKEFRIREKEFDIEIINKEDIENNFFAYGSSRNNSCQLNEDTTGYLSLFSGEYDLKSPTKWLQYLDYSEQKENDNLITVIEAKELLNHLLNSEIEIDISPKGVTFTEKGSKVSFDQLSAGYKGVTTIICDLIARLSEKQQVENITDFQGVVLIDEVELHLHPKWKYNFMKKLRDTFPLIQFIVTTHSPTVILGASKEAVFYKIYKEEGEVKISNQIANEGYTHNSLVSSPLFDLNTITSRDYDNRRVSSDDYVYDKIHQAVSERIKKDVNTSEEDIMKLIHEELDKL